MLESYQLKDDSDTKIGVLSKNLDTGEYSFELDEDFKGKLLPVAFYGVFNQDREKVVSNNVIDNWIKSRIFPPNRNNADELLKELNLTKYNEWEILKRNWGFSPTDSYWLDITGNSTRSELMKKLSGLRNPFFE